MNGGDDFDRICSMPEQQTLVERCDTWAEDYDEAHAAWGWGGPAWVADVLLYRACPDRCSTPAVAPAWSGRNSGPRGWPGRRAGDRAL